MQSNPWGSEEESSTPAASQTSRNFSPSSTTAATATSEFPNDYSYSSQSPVIQSLAGSHLNGGASNNSLHMSYSTSNDELSSSNPQHHQAYLDPWNYTGGNSTSTSAPDPIAARMLALRQQASSSFKGGFQEPSPLSEEQGNSSMANDNFEPAPSLLTRSQTPKLKDFKEIEIIEVQVLQTGESNASKMIPIFGSHLSYLVTCRPSPSSSSGGGGKAEPATSAVYRRYRDFLWIQELLLKRYPYRTITCLPPKKVVGADSVFIEMRRRGLQRFLNFVANHPILSKDDAFITFKTSKSIIQDLKSSTHYNLDEEFLTAVDLSMSEVAAIPIEFDDQIQTFKSSLSVQIDQICNILSLFEKFVYRLLEVSVDYQRLAQLLNLASKQSHCLIAGCESCIKFEEKCGEASKEGLQNICSSLERQSNDASTDLLESLKSYRDTLAGFQLLLYRRDVVIPSLSLAPIIRRISINKNRLVELIARGMSQRELDKIGLMIQQDEAELELTEAKTKFIRYCVWNEFDLVHGQKRKLLSFIQDCLRSQILYSSENLELWTLMLSALTSSSDDE